MLIQKLRLQHGWSQEQLADLSGLSTRTVQRLERGLPASMESLKAIAAVFNVDFNDLKGPDMTPELAAKTTTQLNDEILAFAQVRKIKGFYLHVAQFAIVVTALALFNYFVTPKYPWVLWVMFGWGMGVIAHGLRVFDRVPFLNGDWERRQVEKILGRKL